jgi:acetate kinase
VAASTSQVLVINCGSSSLKFALVEPQSGAVVRQGLAERLNASGARLTIDARESDLPAGASHAVALDRILAELGPQELTAVGHRVVHGGEAFTESAILDDAAVRAIHECAELAPLHNPANLLGIEVARQRFPDVVQVAVFDTAFHQTLPTKAYLYAIPYELYQRDKIRRYGFHGTSHRYVASEAARRLGKPIEQLQLITAHLGNGCSACAVKNGRSVDTTMGLTPLEGLVMGTRSGDVDPNLPQFLVEKTGQTLAQVTDMLNRQSGLLGISGKSNDMRTLLEAAGRDDRRAKVAVEVFCYRLAKAILALCAALDRIDALVFTGGIGEHAAAVRADTLATLKILQPEIDPELNRTHGVAAGGRITQTTSSLLALVIPTNEELVIAREAARLASRALPLRPVT